MGYQEQEIKINDSANKIPISAKRCNHRLRTYKFFPSDWNKMQFVSTHKWNVKPSLSQKYSYFDEKKY